MLAITIPLPTGELIDIVRDPQRLRTYAADKSVAEALKRIVPTNIRLSIAALGTHRWRRIVNAAIRNAIAQVSFEGALMDLCRDQHGILIEVLRTDLHGPWARTALRTRAVRVGVFRSIVGGLRTTGLSDQVVLVLMEWLAAVTVITDVGPQVTAAAERRTERYL